MALTFANEEVHVFGDMKVWLVTATFDSSYPTGGEAIAITDFSGCRSIAYVIPNAPSIDDQALVNVRWDRTNSTLIATVQDGTQEGDTTDLSSTTCELVVIGK